MTLQDAERYEEAVELYERALALHRRVHEELHPDALIALNNLGGVLRRLGRNEEALPYIAEALELKKRSLQDGHPSLVVSYNNLAMMIRDSGDVDGALALFDEAAEMIERTGTEAQPNAIQIRYNHAITLDRAGDPESALGAFEACAELAQDHLGGEHAFALQMEGAAAWQLLKVAGAEEAEERLAEALAAMDEHAENEVAGRAVARIRLGVARRDLGATDEARALLEEGLEMLAGAPPGIAAGDWHAIGMRALATL